MLHMSQEEAASVNPQNLGSLVLDWLKMEAEEEDMNMKLMKEKVILTIYSS